MECRRMSTFSCSASSCALRSGRTLKPMMMAFDADASSTSLSVMAPTLARMTLIFTFSFDSLASRSLSTSTEPPTSPLRMMGSSFCAGRLHLLRQTFQRHARTLGQRASRAFCSRYSEMPRAFSRSATATS